MQQRHTECVLKAQWLFSTNASQTPGGKAMNDDTITTKEMFELLRSDIQNQSSELKAQITDLKAEVSDVRSDLKAEIADVRSDLKAEITDVRSDLKAEITDVRSEISGVRSDIQSLDDRLRNVETAVAGTTAVATYKKTLIDWLFRIAAAVGVGGAIKAFLS